jgi:surface carbohydrate biosynthesis protein
MRHLYLLKQLIKKEKKLKINFQNILSREVVVFDGVSYKDLIFLLEDYDYQIIENRYDRIKELNLSFQVILNVLKNFFILVTKKNFNLPILYYYTIIKLIRPKVVITSIDNSRQFHQLAQLLEKHSTFMAVQNANRLDYTNNDYNFKNKLIDKNYNSEVFIPNFFCFGDHEKKLARNYKLKIKKFYKYGSIRVANFFHYIKKKKINLRDNLFDICLISESLPGFNNRFKQNFIEEGIGILAKYAIKFSIENNLKFVFASKPLKKYRDLNDKQISFYKKHLNQKEFNHLLSNFNERKNIYSSYEAIFQCKVLVGCVSTLLRDKIGLRQKILSCNLTNFQTFNFPINDICSINNCSYDEFANRLKKILNTPINDYFKNIKPNYVMAFDEKESTIKKIKLKINESLLQNEK